MSVVVMTLTDKNSTALDLQVDFDPEINGGGHLDFSYEVAMKFLALFDPYQIKADKRQLNAILYRRQKNPTEC